jgi:hypothetical protein
MVSVDGLLKESRMAGCMTGPAMKSSDSPIGETLTEARFAENFNIKHDWVRRSPGIIDDMFEIFDEIKATSLTFVVPDEIVEDVYQARRKERVERAWSRVDLFETVQWKSTDW